MDVARTEWDEQRGRVEMGKIFSVSFLTRLVAILLSGYHLFTGTFGTPEAQFHRGIHLGGMLFLLFLTFPTRGGKSVRSKVSVFSWLCALLSIACVSYVIIAYDYIQEQ